MKESVLTEQIIQAITGKIKPTRGQARYLAGQLQKKLTAGSQKEITEILSRFIQAGVLERFAYQFTA